MDGMAITAPAAAPDVRPAQFLRGWDHLELGVGNGRVFSPAPPAPAPPRLGRRPGRLVAPAEDGHGNSAARTVGGAAMVARHGDGAG